MILFKYTPKITPNNETMNTIAKKVKKTAVFVEDESNHSGDLKIGCNEDLLTEILLRLPVTSILRFKTVSKHWRSLLTRNQFTHRYDNLSKSPSPGLFASNRYFPFDDENPSPPPFRSHDFYLARPFFTILQSCNGLMLCSTQPDPPDSKDSRKYFVFNPTTKQLALIPSIPKRLKAGQNICFMALAFHQTRCVRYKLVCILASEFEFGNLFQIQIYSSDTREWKISVDSFTASAPGSGQRGVYWNGAVYWTPILRNLLYFNLDAEKLQTMPLPHGLTFPDPLPMILYLGESRGHLHLVVYNNPERDMLRLDVYEMLSDPSGWFVKYQVQLNQLPDAFPDMIDWHGYDFKVIDLVRGEEEEEDTFLVIITPDSMITFNVHDKSFKQMFGCRTKFYGAHVPRFHRYIQMLSSF